ncbi:MAG: hypothetical protein IKI38_04835 [Mogibacterium sp.]|nr:hypothetical protein [Mogibacterium sp.]
MNVKSYVKVSVPFLVVTGALITAIILIWSNFSHAMLLKLDQRIGSAESLTFCFIIVMAVSAGISLLSSMLCIIEDEETIGGILLNYLTQILLLLQFFILTVTPLKPVIFWGVQYICGMLSVRSGYSKLNHCCKAQYSGMFDFLRFVSKGPDKVQKATADRWIAFVLCAAQCVCFFAMLVLLLLFIIFNRKLLLG